MVAQGSFVANAASLVRERLARAFPPAFGFNAKHDYGKDYGWPEQLCFQHFYRMYCRSGIAAAAVDKTIAKTWSTMPALWESEKPAESDAEKAIRKHFAKRQIWRAFMDADRRSMVGCYAAVIILLRDDQKLDQPVVRVHRGIENVAGVIPAWEGQLTVVEWDQVETSETYGEPLFFQYDEQAVGDTQNTAKSQVRIHRDRVLVWSDDGTLNCRSALEPGFNDLTDAEKIKGAGGEGFWKSARGAPIIEAPKGVSAQDVQRGMNAATPGEVIDKLNETVDDFQSGFDKALMLGSFSVSPLTITLPQPKEFWEPCVQSFAASLSIPFKVLIGNVTGERASTEDANEWAQTCMSRRENRVLPVLQEFIDRLVLWGVLEAGDWTIGWDDLLEASPDDKLGRAKTMAEINQSLKDEPAFLPDEIRDAAGFKPADEVEGFAEFMRDRERARQAAEDVATEVAPIDVANRRTRKDDDDDPNHTRGKDAAHFDPSQPRAGDGKWRDTGKGDDGPAAEKTADPIVAEDMKQDGFDDFFAGSKMVDKDGNPMPMFHGTTKKFDTFDKAQGGSNTGPGYGGTDDAFYFTPSRNETHLYIGMAQERAGGDARVLRTYVSAKNPLVLDPYGKSSVSKKQLDSLIDNDTAAVTYAKANGHDAVIWPSGNRVNSGHTVAVLDSDRVHIAGIENLAGKQIAGPPKRATAPAEYAPRVKTKVTLSKAEQEHARVAQGVHSGTWTNTNSDPFQAALKKGIVKKEDGKGVLTPAGQALLAKVAGKSIGNALVWVSKLLANAFGASADMPGRANS